MKFSTQLQAEHVLTDGRATDPREAVGLLLERLAASGALPDPASALRLILEREEEFPTGIGVGVAIPHTSSLPLEGSLIAMGVFTPGVDFGAPDGPARVVFLLLSPPGNSGAHLRMLARISRLARRDLPKRLGGLTDADAVIRALAEIERDFLEL